MPQLPSTLNADDRLAIEDVLGRYFWALDTGDIEGVLELFCQPAVVRYGDGQRYEGVEGLRQFAVRAIGDRSARGRMHINRPLFAQVRRDCVLVRSYLLAAQSTAGGRSLTLVALRYVEDSFVRTTSGWRIRERAIFPWDEGRAPGRAPMDEPEGKA